MKLIGVREKSLLTNEQLKDPSGESWKIWWTSGTQLQREFLLGPAYMEIEVVSKVFGLTDPLTYWAFGCGSPLGLQYYMLYRGGGVFVLQLPWSREPGTQFGNHCLRGFQIHFLLRNYLLYI